MITPVYQFRQVQRITLAAFTLALAFNIFFEVSKHLPALQKVGVFIQDPYDAVGSFGIQLAFLASLFSMVRILRPYPNGIKLENLSLILRGDMLSLLSIGVTLTADLIAVMRLRYRWVGSPSGWELVGFTVALGIMTGLAGWQVLNLSKAYGLPGGRGLRPRSLLVYLAGFALLAFYPETWRWTIPMALIAALLGSLLLFAWSAETIGLVYLQPPEPAEDFLDDLAAVYQWVRAHAGPGALLFPKAEASIQRAIAVAWVGRLAAWLNPRRYAWRFGFVAALGMGILLALSELMDHGLYQLRFIFAVFAIFITIEGTGVIVGYALFRKYLGIFRKQ